MEWLGVWLVALLIQPVELPPAMVGREYTGDPLTTTSNVCGQQSVEWSVANGELPPGLTLSAAGYVSGAAKEPGDWRFGIRTRTGCRTFDRSYRLVVLPEPLLEVHPASITLETPLGRNGEARFSLRAGSNQPGLAYTLETSGQPWLRAHAQGNRIPLAGENLATDLVEVSIDTSQMLPGRHRAWIRFAGWRVSAPTVIPIDARIVPPPAELLAAPMAARLELPPIPPEPVPPRLAPPRPVEPPMPVAVARAPAGATPHLAVSGARPAPNWRQPIRRRRFAAARPKPEAKAADTPKPPAASPPAAAKPAEVKPAPAAAAKPVEAKPTPSIATKSANVKPPAAAKPAGTPKPTDKPSMSEKPASVSRLPPHRGRLYQPARRVVKRTTPPG